MQILSMTKLSFMGVKVWDQKHRFVRLAFALILRDLNISDPTISYVEMI